MEVKVISRELVKPSSPTPSHLKNYTFSYVDQIVPISPPLQTPAIIFYTAISQTQEQPLDITWLKTCLSQTLTRFYPLAGRIKQSTIDCNDEGIPVFETRVNCPLSTVLNSPVLFKHEGLLQKLFPPSESLCIINKQQEISELAHICIQINVFTCGGVAIAWYDIHKLTDGISALTFFKHWASLASRSSDENKLIQPDFGAGITAFPPSATAQPLLIVNEEDQVKQHHCSVVVKSFIFRDAALSKLKLKAASHQVLHPSRFLAVSGFIWEQALLASKTCQKDDKTVFTLNINVRPRMKPPLPEFSIGNLITHAVASAQVKVATLPELVANIHTQVCQKKEEIEEYEGEKGVKAIRENAEKFLKSCSDNQDKAYKITSWCNVGFSDLDFGFGREA
ncbi:vinorine synthase-like [Beta vulgaris subsp. vulgaris]|uniref:vinorine synthase-like n=1 Tax=Beta vulgaris subsp. vulgaris TaxID=3555 RepID=UPI0020369F0C|nr:vinorine synthase-like [Beta vulgaris subsp. vulgaris]